MAELISSGGGGGTDTRTDVSEGGTTQVFGVSDINFADGTTATTSVTDDGDGTVTVDANVDESAPFTWTSAHDWQKATPGSGLAVLQRLAETTNGGEIRWGVNSSGDLELRSTSSGGVINTIYTITPGGSSIDFSETVHSRVDAFIEGAIDRGANAEIRTEYQPTPDDYRVRDQTNVTDRVAIDRTTGDHTIEGTYTEGAAL